jgi:hypothetical protein
VADHPLRPATDRRLGGPLPHQLANRTSAAPIAQGPFESPALLLPDHAVLAHLSMGYPPQLDTFRCVTHPFATRHQGCPRAAVRLACVKHAASVQSEPGSNSSVQILKTRRNICPATPDPLTQAPRATDCLLSVRALPSSKPFAPTHIPSPRVAPRPEPARRHPRLKHKALTPIGCRLLKNGGCGGRI